MARSPDILSAVVDLNFKHYTDQNIAASQLQFSDSLDTRRRSQVLAENTLTIGQAVVTRGVKSIVTLDTEEGSAISSVNDSGVASKIAALSASVNSMAMHNKAIALSPPKSV